jgi:tetratricopeptide (TPR) repeat protein
LKGLVGRVGQVGQCLALSCIMLVVAADGEANQRSRELTLRAYDAAYNLDYSEARTLLTEALVADPNDAAAHRAMAVTAWLRIGFLRGSVTVDDYLGNVTKPNINMTPPPPDEAQRFQQHIARALAIAEAAVRARPSDPDAHFAVGSVVGIQASYGATVEGKVLASFRAAKRAFDEHERVLELAPHRKDPGLIVGTYRYVVAALSLPMRLMAYVAGFGGGRERGLRMIEEAAAAMSGETEVEAKFALLLLYNREMRFGDAMRIVQELQQRYPRNRLLWLEGGATLIRAQQFAAAVSMLDEGLRRLEADNRERMFGEMPLWRYKRGMANVRLGRNDAARADLAAALAAPAREWVQGRVHAELGVLAERAGQRERARAEYRLALQLAERGNDPIGKQEAEALLRR